jgi:hypothetical protein
MGPVSSISTETSSTLRKMRYTTFLALSTRRHNLAVARTPEHSRPPNLNPRGNKNLTLNMKKTHTTRDAELRTMLTMLMPC